jgi:membrane-associated protein
VTAGMLVNSGSVNPLGLDPVVNLLVLNVALIAMAIAGDAVGFAFGRRAGEALYEREQTLFFRRDHLLSTRDYFEKHGGKAIIFARWVPIVRTFAPFVAGMGEMTYKEFFKFSAIGAFLWVWICVLAGYFFGGIPIVKANFEYAMLAMLLLTGGPMVYEAWKHSKNAKKSSAPAAEAPQSSTDSKG